MENTNNTNQINRIATSLRGMFLTNGEANALITLIEMRVFTRAEEQQAPIAASRDDLDALASSTKGDYRKLGELLGHGREEAAGNGGSGYRLKRIDEIEARLAKLETAKSVSYSSGSGMSANGLALANRSPA